MQRMIAEAVSFDGRLDVVVNNAAANPGGSIELMDVAEWCYAMDVNISGTMPVKCARRSLICALLVAVR